MLISDSTAKAFENVAARQRDLMQAFTPGAIPQHGDVAAPDSSDFTLDPLSVSLPADSYLLSRDDNGRLLFTRDGSLSIRDGMLVDQNGKAVLGRLKADGTLVALRIDRVDGALGFSQGAQIENDGTVTYRRMTIDPRTGVREAQRVSLGRLALARFPAGTRLSTTDALHAFAPPGVAPHIGAPADGSFAPLQTFSRQHSGIDVDLGLQRLEEAYTALDALRAAGAAQGNVQKTAMDLLK